MTTTARTGSARTAWADLPAALRSWTQVRLGGEVVEARTAPGGFSPGAASRLRTGPGRRGFLKAVSRSANAQTAELHLREGRLMPALGGDPAIPELMGTYDDGDWVGLLLSDVDGVIPGDPWDHDELGDVLTALAGLQGRWDPAALPGLPEVGDAYASVLSGWRRLAADPPAGLDDWSRRHLDRLATIEAGWIAAAQGTALLHGDLRADNVLRTSSGFVFVDWAWACTGAAWFDVVAFAPSAVAHGGPPPGWLLDRSPAARSADSDAVTCVVIAVAGYFAAQVAAPPPPGLVDPRPWQRRQALAAQDWVRERTGWR